MNNPLKNFSRLDPDNPIPGIISILTKLDTELPQTNLRNLKFFNHTYLIITKNMYEKIQSGSFMFKNEVQQLIFNFVYFYFKAVEDHQNSESLSKAWEITFRFCEKRQSNRLLYLAIAANTHINNDLSFALKKTIKNESFYSDYRKIGEVLELSIRESILSINQQLPLFKFIDEHLIVIYEFIIKFLLKEWRKAAWNNYLELMKKNKIEDHIKLVAQQKANEISAIAYIIPY